MDVVVVVGNPKRRSRSYEAAQLVARDVAGEPSSVIDVADLGAGLLEWGDAAVAAAVEAVQQAQVVVVASPTYKATFTGLVKLFLDQIPANGLDGVVAVPLMLGAGPAHLLAPEVFLKPVLVELGATCPTKGIYLLDSTFADADSRAPWVAPARRQVRAALGSSAG